MTSSSVCFLHFPFCCERKETDLAFLLFCFRYIFAFFSFPHQEMEEIGSERKRKLYPRPNFMSASILFLPPFFSYSFSFFARLFPLQPMHASSSTEKPKAGTTTRGEEEEKRGPTRHTSLVSKRGGRKEKGFLVVVPGYEIQHF